MNKKTQKIIDKLIENILNYASENNKKEESSTLEDKLIENVLKKLTGDVKSEK